MLARLVLWLLIASCVGCDRAEEVRQVAVVPAAPATAVPTVALVMKTLTNPFFIDMEKGARQAESELGLKLLVRTAAQETSIEQQIDIVDSLIRAAVDAIVIAPGDSLELLPVLKQAREAGIVVINIDNRLDPEYAARLGLGDVPFISVDNEQGAYQIARFVAEEITAPTQAAILEGIREAANARSRTQGAQRALSEQAHIKLVATETANWKIDEAYDVIRQLYVAHPDIGLIVCGNDMMALGVLKYLEESGRAGVRVAGFDALEPAKDAIRRGVLAATVDQQAARQGYLGVQYAVRALAGETLPLETYIETLLVTEDTLDAP